MNTNRVSDRQNAVWLMAALAAPLAEAASGCSWLAVLVVGGITLLVIWWLGRYRTEQKPWLDILQGLWAGVVASELLFWYEGSWPSPGNAKAAALILLILAIWSACKARNQAASVGCVLIWPMGILLGIILLSAAPEVRLQNLSPSWQMPDGALVTILLLPALYGGQGKRPDKGVCTGVLCFAFLWAAVTAGVLSPRVSARTEAGIYELSRSISLFGGTGRLESAALAGLTLGYFGGVSYLLAIPEEAANRSRMVLAYGVLAGLLFLMDIRFDSRVIAVGSILLWVILPAICGVKKSCQKTPKDA